MAYLASLMPFKKSFLLFGLLWLLPVFAFSQHTVIFTVADSASGEKLQGVSVVIAGTLKGGSTDSSGKLVLNNIPAGRQTFTLSVIGYAGKTMSLNFPLAAPAVSVLLLKEAEKMEEVIISSSRTDSRIENTPTRVEVLGAEEVEEEGGVKPAHVASLLGDVAGIQSQQTSAVTGSTDLRIQGLPGDYTQILRDGIPLFGGYAGSFSILQIPPLDLKQIEIVKGASSTLYGGGAIAGMINIISKKPKPGVKERYLLP
jgi:outer membrane receptor protein involved in Fe transport